MESFEGKIKSRMDELTAQYNQNAQNIAATEQNLNVMKTAQEQFRGGIAELQKLLNIPKEATPKADAPAQTEAKQDIK